MKTVLLKRTLRGPLIWHLGVPECPRNFLKVSRKLFARYRPLVPSEVLLWPSWTTSDIGACSKLVVLEVPGGFPEDGPEEYLYCWPRALSFLLRDHMPSYRDTIRYVVDDFTRILFGWRAVQGAYATFARSLSRGSLHPHCSRCTLRPWWMRRKQSFCHCDQLRCHQFKTKQT